MRHIEERDRGLLRQWLTAFKREALGDKAPSVEKMVDGRLRGGASGMRLWE